MHSISSTEAFRWEPGYGSLQDINGLLPANSGWVLTSAVSVNDHGIICGSGTRNGQTRAWIYRPKP